MKIIHSADIHLDSKLESILGKDKALIRRSENLATFMRMIDYAVAENVDAILISGDLFDVKRISAGTRNTIVNGITSNPSIKFFYLQGNHDFHAFLDCFDKLPENLYIFNNNWTSYEVGSLSRVCISGIEIDSANNKTLYDSLILPFDKFNIVMLHGQESMYAGSDKTEVINLSALKGKNIDYLALGHIHSYKESPVDGRCQMVYPGCLDPRGFDEPGDHGFVLLTVDESNLTYTKEFVSFASRRVHELEVDVTDLCETWDVIDRISDAIDEKQIDENDLVKVILSGRIDVEAMIDEMAIIKRYEKDFFAFKLANKVQVKINFERFLLDKSLKGAFVRQVMKQDNLTDEDKARIISYGLAALRNEGVEGCD